MKKAMSMLVILVIFFLILISPAIGQIDSGLSKRLESLAQKFRGHGQDLLVMYESLHKITLKADANFALILSKDASELSAHLSAYSLMLQIYLWCCKGENEYALKRIAFWHDVTKTIDQGQIEIVSRVLSGVQNQGLIASLIQYRND